MIDNSRPIKIGFITNSLDYLDKETNPIGTVRYYYNLINELLKNKNLDISLIHFSDKDLDIYKKTHNIVIKPWFKSFLPFEKHFKLFLRLRKLKLDAIHDPGQIEYSLPLFPFKRFQTIHDLSPIIFPRTVNLRMLIGNFSIIPLISMESKKIFTVSQNSKKDILKYFWWKKEKDVHFTYLGYSDKFKVSKERDKIRALKKKYKLNKFILAVGTLQPRKNLVRLIEAFSKIEKQFPDYNLVLMGGKGWMYSKIFEIVKKLNIEQKVKFTGFISDESLISDFYNAADVFVYPSLYEGFGLPPLEAMACGCPVVTSDVSSLPEVVGDAAIKVNPYDIDEIAAAMGNVLSNKSLRQKMIKKGLEQCKKFSWKNCALETFKVYNEALRKK